MKYLIFIFLITLSFQAVAQGCGDPNNPIFSPVSGGDESCISASNIGLTNNDCGLNSDWYEIQTDENAAGIIVSINNSDFNPQIMIVEECGGTPIVACVQSNIISTLVNPNSTYFLSVGSIDGTVGNFNTCVQVLTEFAECSTATLVPSRPDFPNRPTEGPYCPGEIVNFCYNLDFVVDNAGEGNNCQWLQGLVPAVGGGWDVTAKPLESSGPGMGSTWWDSGSVNYQTPFSILTAGDNCAGDPSLTDGIGLNEGTSLPGGWWWTSNGNGANCLNDGTPNTMWGLPAGCGSVVNVNYCFDLQVRMGNDGPNITTDCLQDLTVAVYAFADGQTGCWANNSCAADSPAIFNSGTLASVETPTVVGEQELDICSGQSVNTSFQSNDGISTLLIEGENNPDVTGISESNSGTGGSFLITDILVNNSAVNQEVKYTITASSSDATCSGTLVSAPFVFTVSVLPSLELIIPAPTTVCVGDVVNLETIASGGGAPYTYSWESGETTSSVLFDTGALQLGTYSIGVTITDVFGCIDSEQIELTVIACNEIFLNVSNAYGCINGENEDHTACIEFAVSPPNDQYTIDWNSNGLMTTISGNCLLIDEENTPPGLYEINAIYTDQFGTGEIQSYTFEVVEIPTAVDVEFICTTTDNGMIQYTLSACTSNMEPANWTLFDENVQNTIAEANDTNCPSFIFDESLFTDNVGQVSIPLFLGISNYNCERGQILSFQMDEDCSGIVLVIDEDMDGFASDVDCDDTNPLINPSAEEIPNNDVDEDCDGQATIIDEDMDGFNSDEDCDDTDAGINPDAEDIPDNGIDENCDGMDEMTDSILELNGTQISVFPNPVSDLLTIHSEVIGNTTYSIYSIDGKMLRKKSIVHSYEVVDMTGLQSGLYLLQIEDRSKSESRGMRIVKL